MIANRFRVVNLENRAVFVGKLSLLARISIALKREKDPQGSEKSPSWLNCQRLKQDSADSAWNISSGQVRSISSFCTINFGGALLKIKKAESNKKMYVNVLSHVRGAI